MTASVPKGRVQPVFTGWQSVPGASSTGESGEASRVRAEGHGHAVPGGDVGRGAGTEGPHGRGAYPPGRVLGGQGFGLDEMVPVQGPAGCFQDLGTRGQGVRGHGESCLDAETPSRRLQVLPCARRARMLTVNG